jgi:hypothetical protein
MAWPFFVAATTRSQLSPRRVRHSEDTLAGPPGNRIEIARGLRFGGFGGFGYMEIEDKHG